MNNMFAFGFLISSNWNLLDYSWASFRFALQIMAKLLCSSLCLFDASVELHGAV